MQEIDALTAEIESLRRQRAEKAAGAS